MSQTYSDVDGSGDPQYAVHAQEVLDSWPQIQAYKRRSYELLAGYSPVLDVGCGPGLDLPQIGGPAGSVGLDASRTMCNAARRHGPVINGGARLLPFANGSFGAVRTDRVLQHVADPGDCVAELVRVCRASGRVVVADADQETLSISVPGLPRELCDRVKRLRRDIGYRNGRLVTALPAMLGDLGLTDVTVDGFPLVLTRGADAFGLPGWPRLWREQGGFADDEIDAWERTTAQQPILYSLLYLVVSATKP